MSTKEPKFCIRCGCPRPEKSSKYCRDCKQIMRIEQSEASVARQRLMRKAAPNAERPKAKRQPPKRKPTAEEREAAERARSTNGWIGADVVICKGCRWYSTETYTCDYIMLTGKQRPKPKDCYQHEGTPYAPKHKEG